MKYLCLVYMDEESLDAMPDRDCIAFEESVRKSGRHIAGEALQRVATGREIAGVGCRREDQKVGGGGEGRVDLPIGQPQ